MIRKIILSLFFAAVFVNFLGPIMDPDLPFHLKTGEYIYTHKEIPKDDPFSFYGESVVTDREIFTLSQYWIAQILFYKLYTAAGPAGIIILRALVFSAFIFLIWVTLKKRGMYSALIIATLAAMMLQSAKVDRPQFFSFLFTLIIILLLERFRQKPDSATPLFFIPPLILLWANMHAGFVFGIVLIIIYTSAEALKLLAKKSVLGHPLREKSVLLLTIAALGAVFFSYINPAFNGQILATIESHTNANWIYAGNREYISPIQELSVHYGNRISATLFFFFLGLSSIILLLNVARTKSADITVFSIIIFSSVAGLTAVRYIPFFLATVLPLLRNYTVSDSNKDTIISRDSITFNILLITLYTSLIIFGLKDYSRILGVDKSQYPVTSANFLLENKINANIFNQFNKGSYFLWRLYPHYRLFNDTRFISIEAVLDTDAIANASEFRDQPFNISLAKALSALVPEDLGRIDITAEGINSPKNAMPLWKNLLKQYNIDLIVHEACAHYSKEIYPLILRLLKDDEWVLIYLDGEMLIFLRNKEKHSEFIKKYKLRKELIYDEIILETLPLVKKASATPDPYSSLSLAYAMKGEDDKALTMIEAALELNSNNLVANFSKAYLLLKQKAQNATN